MAEERTDQTQAKAKKRAGKTNVANVVRHVVQVCALLLFCAPMLLSGWQLLGLSAGSGNPVSTPAELPFFGTLSSSSIGPVVPIDPFAVLQVICASKTVELSWIIGLLIVVVVYGIIRGRAFCGWVCPVNLFCEIIDWIRRKAGIKVQEMPVPRRVKVWVALAVLVLSLICSVPVFEVVSPISFINKGLVVGSFAGLFTLIAIVLAELFYGHRVWCRSICPLGGFYQVLGKVGLVNVRIDHEKCIGCNKCKAVCNCDPDILSACIEGTDTMVRSGDCMLCTKCTGVCPTAALAIKIGRTPAPKKPEEVDSKVETE